MRTALALVLAFDFAVGVTDVALAVDHMKTSVVMRQLLQLQQRVVIDPPGPYGFSEETIVRFCVDRVLSWKVRPSVEDAKRELNLCYQTLLPKA